MATAPAANTTDFNAIVAAYIKIREAKQEAAKAAEAVDAEFKEKLQKLEGVLLKHLNDSGTESVRTAAGTFYRQEDVRPNIVDDTAFYSWIKDNDAFDALERRVKKTFVTQFMEVHEGLPPPGIATSREYVVRVRRS